MSIGGNTEAVIQIRTVRTNEIGERVSAWADALPPFSGWLDLSVGDSERLKYNIKLQESTHIFLCDYFPLMSLDGKEITPENSRMAVGGKTYDVMLYDDPMGMHDHLEIYLKYTGGQ